MMLPLIAAAQSTQGVSSYANSGGNTAEEGGVTQSGTSSASVYVETSNGSGTSVVHIETSNNGIRHEETYTTTGSLGVSVTATASGTKTRVWTPSTPGTHSSFMKHMSISPGAPPAETIGTTTSPSALSSLLRWFAGVFSSAPLGTTSSASSTPSAWSALLHVLTRWF